LTTITLNYQQVGSAVTGRKADQVVVQDRKIAKCFISNRIKNFLLSSTLLFKL